MAFTASSEASKPATTDSTETGSSAEPGKEEQEQDDKGKGKDNAEEAKDEEIKKDDSGSK